MSNVKDLIDMGAFIPEGLVKKEIKFSLDKDDGDDISVTIHIRRLSIGAHEKIWESGQDGSSKTAKLLAAAVRLGENGEESMTYAQAYSLHPRLALAMSKAITEVNGGDRKN